MEETLHLDQLKVLRRKIKKIGEGDTVREPGPAHGLGAQSNTAKTTCSPLTVLSLY